MTPIKLTGRNTIDDKLASISGVKKTKGEYLASYSSIGWQSSATSIAALTPFPFIIIDNSYKVTFDKSVFWGVGDILGTNISIIAKYSTCLTYNVTHNGTIGTVYLGTCSMKIYFS